MTLAIWSHGLGAAAYTAFAAYLVRQLYREEGARLRLGALLVPVVCGAAWAWLGLAWELSGDPVFAVAGAFADVLRVGGWYAFLIVLLAGPGRMMDTSSVTIRLLPVAGILVLSGLVIQGLAAGDIGELARLALFHQLAMGVFALVLLEQLYRNVPADRSWNVKPLCLGLAGAFLYDLYLYSTGVLFGHLEPDAAAIRGGVHSLTVPFLAMAIHRSRGWLQDLRISQRAALHTATLLMAGIYLLFVSAVGYYIRYFGGEWGRALELAVSFAALMAFAAVLVSGTMRSRLRVLLGKHFFRYRYDYREEWLRFTHCLLPQESPQAMGRQVIRGLADLLESPAGCLWLKDAGGIEFVQSAVWNMPATAAREDAGSSFCRFLGERNWVINLEEFRCFQGRYEGLGLPAWLAEFPNAWLVVPLMAGQDMLGFAVLASARTPLDVNWEVNDLLKTAGRQAASFLAQMQATEALLEARKFDAFNRMSAFVVHDLKNIVSQLSLLLRNAERHRDNGEFQQDMLMTVQNSVERMRQLMLQLREGAAPAGVPCGVDLARVIGRIQGAKARQGRQLEVDIVDRLVTRGHEERIERVVGHLVQNAIDATEEGGQVWIRLERQGGLARVEVGDDGRGMAPEFLRERLFKPFQTTKPAGMGIGAYESFHYVQELGGKLSVDSELDRGTRVTMLLPVLELGERADFREAEAA